MLIHELVEARRNPEQNPKTPINAAIKQHLDQADRIPGTHVKNSFVSFTEIEKLGINPRSGYRTPLGIYAYPSEYIYRRLGDVESMSQLPFAGDRPWAMIFSTQGNIVVLDFSKTWINHYYRKIYDQSGLPRSTIDNIIVTAQTTARVRTVAGHFWRTTQLLAQELSSQPKWSTEPAVTWNQLFRALGIAGCIDLGRGIIHPIEPTQAVFFSQAAIKDHTRTANKYAPNAVADAVDRGQYVKQYSKKFAAFFAADS